MANAGHAGSVRGHGAGEKKGFAKRMSDHIAVALVVYTLALIFVTMPSIETEGMSTFPLVLLVVLVGGIIPFLRYFEHRWMKFENSGQAQDGFNTRFTIDRLVIWVVAIGVPFALSVACKAIF